MAKHFADSPNTPLALETPFLAPDLRTSLTTELRAWLVDATRVACQQQGILASEAFQRHLKSVTQIVESSLQNQLATATTEQQEQDVIASAMVAILARYPAKLVDVLPKLMGSLLPPILRKFLWARCEI